MPKPVSNQKKPATSEACVTDASASQVESDGNTESFVKRDDTVRPRELGGPAGPEPTRYGDWERKGRCIDF